MSGTHLSHQMITVIPTKPSETIEKGTTDLLMLIKCSKFPKWLFRHGITSRGALCFLLASNLWLQVVLNDINSDRVWESSASNVTLVIFTLLPVTPPFTSAETCSNMRKKGGCEWLSELRQLHVKTHRRWFSGRQTGDLTSPLKEDLNTRSEWRLTCELQQWSHSPWVTFGWCSAAL